MGSNFSKSLLPPSDDSGVEILDSDLESQATLWSLYKRWMKHYQVFRSHKEKRMRFAFFKEQVNFIHASNDMDKPYKLGLNKFSDWSKDEFDHIYVGGNSWLYAAVAAIEAINSIRTGKQTKLADKKAFHDCNMRGFCTCRGVGGDMRMVFLNKEFETTDGELVTIDGYGEIPPNDEEALEEVFTKQPVAAVIDARGDAFRNYAGGIFDEEFGKEPNQSVVIVARDVTSDGEKFWLIRNSWGEEWGEGGYMRMKRGVNLCGIASNAVYPIKNSSSPS